MLAVAGRAEGGDVVVRHKVLHNLVKGAVVLKRELALRRGQGTRRGRTAPVEARLGLLSLKSVHPSYSRSFLPFLRFQSPVDPPKRVQKGLGDNRTAEEEIPQTSYKMEGLIGRRGGKELRLP